MDNPRSIDNGDGTVTLPALGLMFSKATLTPTRISQREALKLCEGLSLGGHSDWRLPTRSELLTLVDDTRRQPAIDTAAFPDTKSDWYWADEVKWSSIHAWYVSFYDGNAGYYYRDDNFGLVRAVRSLPPGQSPSSRCGWSARADLAARRIRGGLLAAAKEEAKAVPEGYATLVCACSPKEACSFCPKGSDK